jgi:predicted DNA-binding transcriptional regulator
VDPISQRLAARELGAGDVVEIDVADGVLVFFRRGRLQRELVS